MFGSLVLIVAAWPEGPEYVLALRFLRSMWIVGLVGTLIYVAGLSAAVKGESFSSGLNPANWFDLFDAGWPGRFAVLRVVLVIATGWVVLKPERVIDPTTNMLALGIPALAVVTLGLSRTGGNLAFLGVVASILHVLAMAVWIGGAVLLARVVLAGPGDEDLVHAVRGFSRISNPAIVITLFSGLIQLYRLDGGELFSSSHGRVVLLKTVAVAAMVFVGMTARQIANARLNRANELNTRNADRLRRVFGTEAAIGLLVIGLSGWLMALTPGKVPDSGDFDIEERFQDQALDFDVEVLISPGRVGLNELEVVVNAPPDRSLRAARDVLPANRGVGHADHHPSDPPDRRRRGPLARSAVIPARRRRNLADPGVGRDAAGHGHGDQRQRRDPPTRTATSPTQPHPTSPIWPPRPRRAPPPRSSRPRRGSSPSGEDRGHSPLWGRSVATSDTVLPQVPASMNSRKSTGAATSSWS